MQDQDLLTVLPKDSGAIARNYAFILAGCLLFPFMIVAHFTARKRRRETEGFQRSHYVLQFRTTSFALLGFLVVGLMFFTIIVLLSSHSIEHFEKSMVFGIIRNVSWLIALWIAIRCVRGIYLCAAHETVQNPRTLWLWPR